MFFFQVALFVTFAGITWKLGNGATQLGPPQVCRCYTETSTSLPGRCPPGASCPPPAPKTATAGPNQPCVIGSTQCPSGYTCSCGGYCRKQASFDVNIVADDGVILWICGVNVRRTNHFDELQSFTYTGICDDFIFEVNNIEYASGISALFISSDGQKYGTTSSKFSFPGTTPLYGRAIHSPPDDNWRKNAPDYPYSSWSPAVVVENILGHGANFNKLQAQGAYPIGTAPGDVDPGTIAVRVPNPFC